VLAEPRTTLPALGNMTDEPTERPGCVHDMGLRFDRTVSESLLGELRTGGRFRSVVELARQHPNLLDLQLRKARGPWSYASLYVGLTTVLQIRECDGFFRLDAHATHQRVGQFDRSWTRSRPAEELAGVWPQVDDYLRRMLLHGAVAPRWVAHEGAVQAAVCSGRRAVEYGPVQREAVVWDESGRSESELVADISDRLWAAVTSTGRTDPWWPGEVDHGKRPGMGRELDVLAIGRDGRLLCLEVKPADAATHIPWSCAQTLVYADLFARWAAQDPSVATDSLNSMAAQRASLDLLDERWSHALSSPIRVVPVLAIGEGPVSPTTWKRVELLAEALGSVPLHAFVDPLEVWRLDREGNPISVLHPGSQVSIAREVVPGVVGATPTRDDPESIEDDDEPAPAMLAPAEPNEFRDAARRAAIAWKQHSPLLPSEAREPATYFSRPGIVPDVLPLAYRDFNLLPGARDIAKSRFLAAGVWWHGDGGGPNPHLRSSQIQCLNALAPLVERPGELATWLGAHLPVDEILPFGAPTDSEYDMSDHAVFEWQGLADPLGEWYGRVPTRGTKATSVDAAIRYRTPDGRVELALIEWKYTESYLDGGALGGAAWRQRERLERYRPLFHHPDAPIALPPGLDYEDLFAEPVYQLLRLQLLAWRLEQMQELDIDRAVVVYAAPFVNRALMARSLGTPRFAKHAQLAGGLVSGWQSLLRRPDRFVAIDTAGLLGPSGVTDEDFNARYAHLHSDGTTQPTSERGTPLPVTADRVVIDDLEETMTGDELEGLAFYGNTSHVWIGRRGGLLGSDFQEDVETSRWRGHAYRVRTGIAAPNRNWFGHEDFVDAVMTARREAREAIGWNEVGYVSLESATVAVANPLQARRLDPDGENDEVDGMVLLVTREDNTYPVEIRTVEGEVVEVRIDLVTDVDELEAEGSWLDAGVIDSRDDGLIAFDPYLARGSFDVPVDCGMGRWDAAIFEHDSDRLALRLLRKP
jgi:hypothetical protein